MELQALKQATEWEEGTPPSGKLGGGVSQWSDTCTKPQVERPGTPSASDPMGTLGGLLTKGKQLIINQHFVYVVILQFVHLGKPGK